MTLLPVTALTAPSARILRLGLRTMNQIGIHLAALTFARRLFSRLGRIPEPV